MGKGQPFFAHPSHKYFSKMYLLHLYEIETLVFTFKNNNNKKMKSHKTVIKLGIFVDFLAVSNDFSKLLKKTCQALYALQFI